MKAITLKEGAPDVGLIWEEKNGMKIEASVRFVPGDTLTLKDDLADVLIGGGHWEEKAAVVTDAIGINHPEPRPDPAPDAPPTEGPPRPDVTDAA